MPINKRDCILLALQQQQARTLVQIPAFYLSYMHLILSVIVPSCPTSELLHRLCKLTNHRASSLKFRASFVLVPKMLLVASFILLPQQDHTTIRYASICRKGGTLNKLLFGPVSEPF
jgi:hypothetical protein